MGQNLIGRRTVVAAGMSALGGAGIARGEALPLPGSPVTLNIIDVAGALQIDRPAIELFVKQNPSLVARISTQMAPSPELTPKLKAMQAGGRVDIDFVLLGLGPLSDGITQDVWTRVLPDLADMLPDLDRILVPGAHMLQENFGRGFGVIVSYTP